MKTFCRNLFPSIFILFLLLFIACEKEKAISDETVDSEYLMVDGDIVKVHVSVGAELSNTGSFIDLASGAVYESQNIDQNYFNVDLAYIYGDKTGNNLVVPNAKGISFSQVGGLVEHGFPYKNEGELYILRDATTDDVDWFNSLNKSTQITQGFDSLKNVIETNMNPTEESTKRVTNIQRGDIILYHSLSRDFKSILLIESIGNSLSSRMTMQVKSDCTDEIYFEDPGLDFKNITSFADTLSLSINSPKTNENYIDFLNGVVYKDRDFVNDDLSDVYLIHTYDGDAQVFYTPTSPWIANSGYRVDLEQWLSGLSNLRTIHLLQINNRNSYVEGMRFEDVKNYNAAIKSYGTSIWNTSDWASRAPGSTGQSLTANMVVRVRDVDNDLWGIIKVLSVDNDKGNCTIAYKFYKNEEL